jgi:hypothetical protein
MCSRLMNPVCSPSIIPYACGYPSCLSRHDDASTPSARTSHDSRGTNDLPSSFATSAELSEHVKSAHENEIVEIDAKPFRCALPECGKSWKVRVNLAHHHPCYHRPFIGRYAWIVTCSAVVITGSRYSYADVSLSVLRRVPMGFNITYKCAYDVYVVTLVLIIFH